MKTLTATHLALIVALFTLNSSQAGKTRFGSECGLPNSIEDETWVETTESLSLGQLSSKKIQALPTLIKQQIILAAKDQFRDEEEHGDPIEHAVDAVEYFRLASEGGDVYLTDALFEGKTFTQLVYYPGGNPVGVIFEKGHKKIIATISDADVVCK